MLETIPLHRVIVSPVTDRTTSGARMVVPPADAFDPATVRVVPVSQVRAGDVLVGTVQPHYGPLLERLDRAEWVSYFSHTTKPQSVDARPFDPAHCDWCTHNAVTALRDGSCWTVDGCTTYRPDMLLLVVPRELVSFNRTVWPHAPVWGHFAPQECVEGDCPEYREPDSPWGDITCSHFEPALVCGACMWPPHLSSDDFPETRLWVDCPHNPANTAAA